MPDQLITCPNCGTEFEVGDVLTDSIRSQLRTELEADLVKKQEDVTKRLNDAKRMEKELAERADAIDDAVAERLEAERRKVVAAERQRVEKELKGQLEDLQEQLDERSKKLDDANKRERDLLKRQRELQEKEQSIDLEIERRLQEAQKGLFEDAMRKAQEANQLKMREKDDLIDRLNVEMKQLQRRMEQGSQEGQGEALEDELRDSLVAAFPFDTFNEVKKGAYGADIVQTVKDRQGRACGTILWEAKNAKSFQRAWLDKLKQDQMEAGAAVAVLMTVTLPTSIKRFGQTEDGGVWITDYASAVGLCSALRQQLMQVMRERIMVEHRETAKDILFEYVTGQEFNMRVRAMTDTYIQMQQDLESEKRALQRSWKKREKQIAKVLENVAGMRGELEGMVGTQVALPDVEPLSLDHLAADEDLDEELDDGGEEYNEGGDEETDNETTEKHEEEEADKNLRELGEETKSAKDAGKWWGRRNTP
jgi:hypothetical protein